MTTEVRTPVFVFGALRSGTTVFRLMLNAHERIGNPGEVDFLFECLRRDPSQPAGWRYDFDKLRASRIFRAYDLDLPEGLDGLDLLRDMIGQFRARMDGVLTMNVHRYARMIAETLPEARFIHLLRDPRDVARSSIGMGWAGVSYYGVDHWVETERSWDRAEIDPEHVLTLGFEGLMRDLERELGKVCAFLGVPFSAAMLDYHLDTTYARPDPRLIEQWRRKATPREVALIEGKCGALLAARGYTPSGDPALPEGLERASLHVRNRIGRFLFNVRRFGVPLVVASKLAEVTGARRLNDRLSRRKDEVAVRWLK